MTKDTHITYRGICMVSLILLSASSVVPAIGSESNKSTGTGTAQSEDGTTSTRRGGNTGPTTGRNADSGSATGKVRDPRQSEPNSENKTKQGQSKSEADGGGKQAPKEHGGPYKSK